MQIKFEWTEEMSVFDEAIDNQHKKLLEKINELYEAILEGRERRVVAEIVFFLGDYILDHLMYEEDFMKEHSFPDFENHKKIHDNFSCKYVEFLKRLTDEEPLDKIASEVEVFLGNWWIEHIGREDKKYANFIKENGC